MLFDLQIIVSNANLLEKELHNFAHVARRRVVLSFGIPVALVPLVLFTSNSGVMGILRNRRPTTILAGTLAAMISFLNAFLVYQSITG